MTPPTARLEAARLLGVPTREISDVTDSPAGRVITTTDGVSYLDCIEPDGAGITGLMYLAAPTEKYSGAFPVYTAPAPAEGDPAPAEGTAAAAAPTAGAVAEAKAPAKKERAALAKKAAGLGITVTRDMDADAIAAAIAAAEGAQ